MLKRTENKVLSINTKYKPVHTNSYMLMEESGSQRLPELWKGLNTIPQCIQYLNFLVKHSII